jgi:hypothetical protein
MPSRVEFHGRKVTWSVEVTLRDHYLVINLGTRSKGWQVLNLANTEEILRSKAEDRGLFLKKSLEMRSGQISLERLCRGK